MKTCADFPTGTRIIWQGLSGKSLAALLADSENYGVVIAHDAEGYCIVRFDDDGLGRCLPMELVREDNAKLRDQIRQSSYVWPSEKEES